MQGIRWMFLAFVALAAGCATAPSVPPELRYNPPLAPYIGAASIMGSETHRALLDNFTAYVMGVDGRRVMAGRDGWKTQLMLSGGRHVITVAFQRGVFSATANLGLDAGADARYEVRFDSNVQLYGANTYCDFWIVDLASGKAVTVIQRGAINGGGGAGAPIFIPIRK